MQHLLLSELERLPFLLSPLLAGLGFNLSPNHLHQSGSFMNVNDKKCFQNVNDRKCFMNFNDRKCFMNANDK